MNAKERLLDKKQSLLLGDFLVSQGLISDDQLRTALKYQKEKGKMLGRALIDLDFLNEQEMIRALGENLGVQYVSLKTYRIDPEVISLIPEHIARGHQVLPLFRIDNTLTVGMVNPLDVVAIDSITRVTQFKVSPVVCSEVDLREAVDYHYGHAVPAHEKHDDAAFVRVVDGQVEDHFEDHSTEAVAESAAENVAMDRLFETLLLSARRNNASFVHIESRPDDLLVRHRIDGRLVVVAQHPAKLAAPLIRQILKRAGIPSGSGRLRQGRLRADVEGEIIDAAASHMTCVHGESVVLRLGDRSSSLRLEDMGLQKPVFEAIKSTLAQAHGILTIASPMSGGRSAMLYALLRELQSAERNIVTLEETIEEVLDGCRQVPLPVNNGPACAEAFQAALQQDADVIVVSHLYTEEVTRLAVSAALDGKFVLLGIPAHDAVAGAMRILDLGVKPHLLAATLRASIAQRMMRKVCVECRQPEPALPETRQYLPGLFDQPATVYRGRGCPACQGTGYRGRTLLAELLPGNEAVQSIFRNASTSGVAIADLKKHLVSSLTQDGIDKMLQGVTTWEEIVRVTNLA
jgi:type II secretory ATPase GspE/PulE/Tfp pilus assembly ATPase PilB-like protein